MGNGPVAPGYYVGLTIDGTAVAETIEVPAALDSDETWSGSFTTAITLSGASDSVQVCADCNAEVDESDEQNNCLINTVNEGGTVSGRVLDGETGLPIAGASIVVSDFEQASRAYFGATNVDGYYTVVGVSTGQYRAYAYATGYVREYYQDTYGYNEAASVSVTVPEDTPNIDFNLDIGGTISGRVLDSATGQPIAGAMISVHDYSLGYHYGWGVTDADGYYTTSAVLTGEHRVQARAEGYTTEYYQDTPHHGEATPVSVTAPGDTPNIDFSLEPAGITWCVDLVDGWNIIALAADPTTPYTASTLAGDVNSQGGGVSQVFWWNAAAGTWDFYLVELGYGTDFDIEVGYGYLLKNTEAATWCYTGTPLTAAYVATMEPVVTNVADKSFTISWVSQNAEEGYVNYGTDAGALDGIRHDDRRYDGEDLLETPVLDDTHHVTVTNLEADTPYYFVVVSGGTTYDDSGVPFEVTTGHSLAFTIPEDIATGMVYQADGITPAEGAIIYARIGTSSSQCLSVLTDDAGVWGLDITAIRTEDLQDYYPYADTNDMTIEAEGAADGTGSQTVTVATALAGAPAMMISLTVEMDLVGGWNLIALPIEPRTAFTASTMAADINAQGGNVTQVFWWNAPAGSWDFYLVDIQYGTDFDIGMGEGYLLKNGTAMTWAIGGPPVEQPTIVSGRVLWNEQPVAGSEVQIKETGSFYSEDVLASALTDVEGYFTITDPPAAGGYMIYATAPSEEYWGWLGRPITIAEGANVDAGVFYLAKRLILLAPANGATIADTSPTLSWQSFPDSVRYDVGVFNDHTYEAVFRQSVSAPENSITVAPSLIPGVRYQWSVHAYNFMGHQIAYYSPWTFTVE